LAFACLVFFFSICFIYKLQQAKSETVAAYGSNMGLFEEVHYNPNHIEVQIMLSFLLVEVYNLTRV